MQLSNLTEIYVCTFWFNISVFKNAHPFGAMIISFPDRELHKLMHLFQPHYQLSSFGIFSN